MSTWADKESTCTECGARIEWWGGGDGMNDWYDPDRHDLDSPGNHCPVSVTHEPAEVNA